MLLYMFSVWMNKVLSLMIICYALVNCHHHILTHIYIVNYMVLFNVSTAPMIVVIIKCFICHVITGCWLMSIHSSVLLTRSPRGYRWGCVCHSEDMQIVIIFRWQHMVPHHALLYYTHSVVNQLMLLWMMISEWFIV